MKFRLLPMVAALASALVTRAQACWTEFGAQDTITAQAGADLSACKYHIMRVTGAGQVINIASDANGASAVGLPLGVLQTNPLSGRFAPVAYAGISKVVTGAAVTLNGLVSTNGSGRAIDATSGVVVIGRALEATAADGQVASVLLFPPVRWGAVT